jgi:hypothetical protein
MLLEAETNKYCPGGYDFGAISNLITWVLNFFLSVWEDIIRKKVLKLRSIAELRAFDGTNLMYKCI